MMKNCTLNYARYLTQGKSLLALLIVATKFDALLFKKNNKKLIMCEQAVAAAISRRQLAQPLSRPNRTKEI